jgi:hypothetical protein
MNPNNESDQRNPCTPLALFLVEQLDSIGAHNYSAPAIHISTVIEREVQQSIFACLDAASDVDKPQKRTLFQRVVFQSAWRPLGYSAINVLLLAWKKP